MSRGPGKVQGAIAGLFDGTRPRRLFGSGALTTGELPDELAEAGLFEGTPRRQALFAVRRACDGLVRRGVLAGSYTRDCETFSRTVSWEAAP